jgi:inactivated superfamily I helicase
MSNRATRRAAERLANKTAAPTAANNISEAQLNANRANAQSSTGPTSPTGKATSSLNAVKTGLTGRTVLLPGDDAIIYQQHLHRYFTQFAPATDQEKALVQTIADTEWRLLRIAPLEAGIYAIGQLELADRFPDERNPINRQALI